MARTTPAAGMIMTGTKRILIEILGPPFLAAVLLSAFRGMWSWREFSFVLFWAYLFGIVPSFIYAAAMELWIRSGGARKHGWESTLAVSTLLGLVVGVVFLFTLDPAGGLLLIGLAVGFLLGLALALSGDPAKRESDLPSATNGEPPKNNPR